MSGNLHACESDTPFGRSHTPARALRLALPRARHAAGEDILFGAFSVDVLLGFVHGHPTILRFSIGPYLQRNHTHGRSSSSDEISITSMPFSRMIFMTPPCRNLSGASEHLQRTRTHAAHRSRSSSLSGMTSLSESPAALSFPFPFGPDALDTGSPPPRALPGTLSTSDDALCSGRAPRLVGESVIGARGVLDASSRAGGWQRWRAERTALGQAKSAASAAEANLRSPKSNLTIARRARDERVASRRLGRHGGGGERGVDMH